MELIETSNADLFPDTPSVSSASLCKIFAYWSLTRNYRIASYGEMIANDAFDGNKNFAIDNGLKDAGYAAYADYSVFTSLIHSSNFMKSCPHTCYRTQLANACHRSCSPAHVDCSSTSHQTEIGRNSKVRRTELERPRSRFTRCCRFEWSELG